PDTSTLSLHDALPICFEIAGTRGKLLLEGDKLSFTRNEIDMIQFSQTAKLGFAKPEVWQADIPFENAANPHAILVQNFVNSIVEDRKSTRLNSSHVKI